MQKTLVSKAASIVAMVLEGRGHDGGSEVALVSSHVTVGVASLLPGMPRTYCRIDGSHKHPIGLQKTSVGAPVAIDLCSLTTTVITFLAFGGLVSSCCNVWQLERLVLVLCRLFWAVFCLLCLVLFLHSCFFFIFFYPSSPESRVVSTLALESVRTVTTTL